MLSFSKMSLYKGFYLRDDIFPEPDILMFSGEAGTIGCLFRSSNTY